MYDAPEVKAVRSEAQTVLAELFGAYRADPGLLPAEWRPRPGAEPLRAIGDFVAGMTDRFAVRCHGEILGAPLDDWRQSRGNVATRRQYEGDMTG